MAVLRELAALVALALFVVGLGSAGLAITDHDRAPVTLAEAR